MTGMSAVKEKFRRFTKTWSYMTPSPLSAIRCFAALAQHSVYGRAGDLVCCKESISWRPLNATIFVGICVSLVLDFGLQIALPGAA